jgi:hypothetical protein
MMAKPARFSELPEAVRWGALVWLAIWIPAYWRAWGPVNFLHLCDVAVLLTCIGLWTGNRLLLSSQAVSSLLANCIWSLDAACLLFLKRPFFGGTEFLLNQHIHLWVRLLSFYHVVVPVVLLWALSRIGYDRRALALQCGILLTALLIGRFTSPFENINFAFRDPFWGRQLGPLPLHIAISIAFGAIVVYAPAHLILLHLYGRAAKGIRERAGLQQRDQAEPEPIRSRPLGNAMLDGDETYSAGCNRAPLSSEFL